MDGKLERICWEVAVSYLKYYHVIPLGELRKQTTPDTSRCISYKFNIAVPGKTEKENALVFSNI
jgi:hypothetical protein